MHAHNLKIEKKKFTHAEKISKDISLTSNEAGNFQVDSGSSESVFKQQALIG